LRRLLAWGDAHVDFERAVAGIPVAMRGKRPAKLPYSPWELIEHMRLAQHDILDFCVNPDYREMKWPDDYWPASPAPRPASAWSRSLGQFRQDREALQRLTSDPAVDLSARIPHGTGQTFMREIILVADHTSYHVGQLVLVRRLLGIWKEK
jgi:hypothetical protein